MPTAPALTTEQSAQALILFGLQKLEEGRSPADVEAILMDEGLEPEVARSLGDALRAHQAAPMEIDREANPGMANMAVGALFAIGGGVATAWGYSAASDGGGTYVVFWGAIAFGVVKLFQGLIQLSD